MPDDTKQSGEVTKDTPTDDLQLHIKIPDELQAATYANWVNISYTPTGEFVVTFGQIPPLRDEIARQDALRTGTLDVRAVANVVIGREMLPRVIDTLQASLDKVQQREAELEE